MLKNSAIPILMLTPLLLAAETLAQGPPPPGAEIIDNTVDQVAFDVLSESATFSAVPVAVTGRFKSPTSSDVDVSTSSGVFRFEGATTPGYLGISESGVLQLAGGDNIRTAAGVVTSTTGEEDLAVLIRGTGQVQLWEHGAQPAAVTWASPGALHHVVTPSGAIAVVGGNRLRIFDPDISTTGPAVVSNLMTGVDRVAAVDIEGVTFLVVARRFLQNNVLQFRIRLIQVNTTPGAISGPVPC